MRSAEVYRNKQLVGVISKLADNTYAFRYHDDWYHNQRLPPVSLTMPKTKQVYTSEQLFPFFFNMLSEGVNRKLQCRHLKIDEKDHFSWISVCIEFWLNRQTIAAFIASARQLRTPFQPESADGHRGSEQSCTMSIPESAGVGRAVHTSVSKASC